MQLLTFRCHTVPSPGHVTVPAKKAVLIAVYDPFSYEVVIHCSILARDLRTMLLAVTLYMVKSKELILIARTEFTLSSVHLDDLYSLANVTPSTNISLLLDSLRCTVTFLVMGTSNF
jgi:hypothetical protein